jgi:hypothetical protein
VKVPGYLCPHSPIDTPCISERYPDTPKLVREAWERLGRYVGVDLVRIKITRGNTDALFEAKSDSMESLHSYLIRAFH